MKKLLLLAVICFSFVSVFSQSKRVSGIITAQDATPLSGATITVKGTQKSVVSDANGAFDIEVLSSDPKSLIISYIGHQTAEVDIKISRL